MHMGAEESQDLQLVGWGPRRAASVSSSLRVGVQSQEKTDIPTQEVSQEELPQTPAFLFYSGLRLVG